MKSTFKDIRVTLQQPWLICILLVTSIPLFPEYLAPIFACLALWAAYRDRKKRGKTLVVGTGGKILMVYMAYMAIGILYSRNRMSTFTTLLMWLVMFMAYVALTSVLANRHRFDTAMFSMCIFAGIIGLIAIFQYVLNAFFRLHVSGFFWGWIDNAIYQILPLKILIQGVGLRASSTFTNPNILGEYLVMVLPFVIYYSFKGQRTRVRLLCRFCALFAMGGLAFTFTRCAYLALIAILVILCLSNYKQIWLWIMAGISVLALVPESVINRLFSIMQSDTSINGRYKIWGICLNDIAKNPIFGYGTGTENTWAIIQSGGYNAPHAHNLALQLLMEGGIIGLGIILFLAFKILRRSTDLIVHRDEDTRYIGFLLLSFVVGFCVVSMFEFPFMTPKLVGIFVTSISLYDIVCSLYLERKPVSFSELFASLKPRKDSSKSVTILRQK